jgi:hypothetical protein
MLSRSLFLLLLASPLLAAPPSVTTLSPAGGQRGTTVAVTAAGTFDKWPVGVRCGTPGVTTKAEKDKGKFAVTVAADAPLGVAWLRFHDDTGASQLRPFVVGGLAEVNETEPNDDARTAPTITLPAVANGVLAKSGDVDCFTAKLRKGETLVASLDANRTLRAPMDAVLQITSADGTVLAQNHDARGLDPEVTYTATADGTFAVRLFAFPSQPDSSVRHFGSPACVYRLTLTAGEFVDFPTPLAVERDREAALTLRGWNLKSKTVKLGKADTAVGVAHPFPVAREPHPCLDLAAGGSDKPLTPPFTATGRVAKAGTASVVKLDAPVGKSISIRLDSAALGLALTPVLKVTDAAGKQLLRAEPAALGGGIDATFTPPAGGPVNLEVRDLFASASSRHVYRLRVTPVVADVDPKVAADRFTLAVGTPLDVPITVTRKGGFAGELVPFAEGLPDGVTAAVGTPAKPDPNAVVLRLTATKPAGGAFRVGVAKKGDDTFRRLASAAVTDFGTTTEDLWLTVPAPAKK